MSELKALVQRRFGEYGALLDHVDIVVEELIERQRRNTCERIKWLLELENPPFTNNSHYFASFREKYLTKYKEARQVCGLFSMRCVVIVICGFVASIRWLRGGQY